MSLTFLLMREFDLSLGVPNRDSQQKIMLSLHMSISCRPPTSCCCPTHPAFKTLIHPIACPSHVSPSTVSLTLLHPLRARSPPNPPPRCHLPLQLLDSEGVRFFSGSPKSGLPAENHASFAHVHFLLSPHFLSLSDPSHIQNFGTPHHLSKRRLTLHSLTPTCIFAINPLPVTVQPNPHSNPWYAPSIVQAMSHPPAPSCTLSSPPCLPLTRALLPFLSRSRDKSLLCTLCSRPSLPSFARPASIPCLKAQGSRLKPLCCSSVAL